MNISVIIPTLDNPDNVLNAIEALNKQDVFPKNAILTLPKLVILDFLDNEASNYLFVNSVKNKEILIEEERVVYVVLEGDYLGKIAEEHSVKVFELKKWNKLLSTRLDVGDRLIVYVKKRNEKIPGHV